MPAARKFYYSSVWSAPSSDGLYHRHVSQAHIGPGSRASITQSPFSAMRKAYQAYHNAENSPPSTRRSCQRACARSARNPARIASSRRPLRPQALLGARFRRHRLRRLLHLESRAPTLRPHLGELGAEEKDLRGVVHPDHDDDEGAGGPVGGGHGALAEIEADEEFAGGEEERGDRG